MDMLNADLLLENEVTSAKGKGKNRSGGEDENEAGFHFIAFMPIEGQLWKLDGLERQPMCLGRESLGSVSSLQELILFDIGASNEDWLSQAKPDIEARMAQYEEGQIEFAILSLVRDPLIRLIPAWAENVKGVAALSAKLDAIKSDWRDFTAPVTNGESAGHLNAPDPGFGLTQELFDHTSIPEEVVNLCNLEVVTDIVEHRQELITAEAELRMSIREEMQADQTDEERATARSRDYGAMIQKVLRKVRTKKAATSAPDLIT